MHRFNPEKELNKIQKGNKNKIILGVISLLLIVAIGSSYALYQIKYNKRIIYTTVDKFYSKDIQISVYVNGEEREEFPDKSDNYSYSGYECENDSTVTFDYNEWTAQIKSTGPDKCKINFGPKNSFYDTLIASEDVIIDDTKDANLRYIGATPSNYIWFNCLKYEGLTKENAETDDYKCERWRIIGILNDMTIVNEDTNEETTNQSLVKVRRAENIGAFSWDNKDTTTGADSDNGRNNWSDARLMKLLNPGYDEEEKGGSLYWNADSGECYVELNNATKSCNFTETGLKNGTTKNIIENVKWYLGGTGPRHDIMIATAKLFYIYERGLDGIFDGYSENPSEWVGKVGLVQASDYGYSTAGDKINETFNREMCLAYPLIKWQDDYKTYCSQNSWIFDSAKQWMLNTTERSNTVLPLSGVGSIGYNSYAPGNSGRIYPTLYLTSNVKIAGGEGSSDNPYILSFG